MRRAVQLPGTSAGGVRNMVPGMDYLTELISQAMDTQIWQDDGAVKLYLYCLSHASHNVFKWRGISVQPGDLPLSERHAAGALMWSRNKLDRKLRVLEEAGLITVLSATCKGTMIHLVHWPKVSASDFSRLHDEAGSGTGNEAAANESGSIMKPQTKPAARTDRPQDGAGLQRAGIKPEPDWSYGEAGNGSNSSKMEPNPIEKKSISSLPASEPDGFTSVWIAYPSTRRTQRREAALLVSKALEDGATIESILSALEAEKQSDDWQQENGRFIPGIVKWLEKENWRSFLQHQGEPDEEEEQWTSW